MVNLSNSRTYDRTPKNITIHFKSWIDKQLIRVGVAKTYLTNEIHKIPESNAAKKIQTQIQQMPPNLIKLFYSQETQSKQDTGLK
jgi:hypothetical protein